MIARDANHKIPLAIDGEYLGAEIRVWVTLSDKVQIEFREWSPVSVSICRDLTNAELDALITALQKARERWGETARASLDPVGSPS